jgi:HD-like signal output (HDOD) protein
MGMTRNPLEIEMTLEATVEIRTLDDWMRRLGEPEIPVLRRTVRRFAALRTDEEQVDPQRIAQVVLGDPLMTLKLLRRIVTRRSRRIVTDTETVTAAVLLMGVPPFFREFDGQPTVEDAVGRRRDRLRGVLTVLLRSRRAALLAVGFAVHRQDTDAELIYEAAMLDEFAEMLLWCHEPDLAAEIAARQRADSSLRTARVQREVLGVELAEVGRALLKRWQMPESLLRLTDPHDPSPRSRNVRLAVRTARHLDSGWGNPALPDDLEEIGALLNLSPAAARRRIDEILG